MTVGRKQYKDNTIQRHTYDKYAVLQVQALAKMYI